MAKGYWIGRVDVSNDEGYKPYAVANGPIFKKWGARFAVRAGKFTTVEGASQHRAFAVGNRPRQGTAHPAAGSSNNQAHV